MKKEMVYSFLLLAFSTVVAILLAEMIAKKVIEKDFVYWSAFIPDDKIGWRFRPNAEIDVEWYAGTKQHMVSNRFGYRDSRNPADMAAGATVVAIQGDSNLIGYGVHSQNLVSNVLEGMLNSREHGQKYQVINAGTSGYDLQNYVLQFPEIEKSYRPQYNFVFFNMDNDHLYSFLSTPYNLPRPFHDLHDGELKLHQPEFRIRSQLFALKFIPSMMSENQHVRNYYFGTWDYGYLEGIAGQSYLAYLVASRLGQKNKLSQFIGFHPGGMKITEQDYAESFAFCMLPRYQENWHPIYDRGQQLIMELLKTYRSYPNSKTVVVLLPDKLDVASREELEEMFRKYNVPGVPDHGPFYTRMKRSITEAGLDYIDLRPMFMEHGDVADLFLQGNSHVGPQGHELIASVIANYIGERQ